MGWHECEYCLEANKKIGKNNTSSGDVIMEFASGRSWIMPDMILHYSADHGYLPPQEFIDDVMNNELLSGKRMQSKGVDSPTKVGYLSGLFKTGNPPSRFYVRLAYLIIEAKKMGNRTQYRGGKK